MHEALGALLAGRPVTTTMWASFWDELGQDSIDRCESGALLASLTASMTASMTTGGSLVEHDTLANFVDSLVARRTPAPSSMVAGTVNIVGTGGGPATFNISTAAALVAAALGVPVVKTGSRAYTSICGSIDLLDRLGIPLTKSFEQTAEMVDRHGIAFAGYFVYPVELTALARHVLPLPMRAFGGLINLLGPFLPTLPGTTQLTGVSSRGLLPLARRLARTVDDRSIWVCSNDLGADELISFAANVVSPDNGHAEIHIDPYDLGTAPGDLDELASVLSSSRVVEHFLDVISARAGAVAVETVSLNAAAMVVAAGQTQDWKAAMTSAAEAMRSGAVVDLVHRLRRRPTTAPALSKVATP